LGEARLGEIQEPVTPVVEKSIDQSSIAEDQAVEAAVNEGENTSSESTSIESVGNAQDPVPVIPLEQGSISVVFSGECWFTLKNGEGKTVIADLKKAGDEISYTGALPFNVVVGAVSEVTVIFEDELIDFSTVRVRNNRASLELTHLN
jgi:cytoskeleton protein RodZ